LTLLVLLLGKLIKYNKKDLMTTKHVLCCIFQHLKIYKATEFELQMMRISISCYLKMHGFQFLKTVDPENVRISNFENCRSISADFQLRSSISAGYIYLKCATKSSLAEPARQRAQNS
jgi:hypothetical protein